MTSPRQLQYLNAIGIPVWVSREHMIVKIKDKNVLVDPEDTPCVDSASSIIEKLQPADSVSASKPLVQNEAQIEVQIEKNQQSTPTSDSSKLGWSASTQTVVMCSLNKILSDDKPQAKWMLVGEVTNGEETQQGQLFSGLQGQLLSNMLRAINLKHDGTVTDFPLNCGVGLEEKDDSKTSDYFEEFKRQLDTNKVEMLLVIGHVAAQAILQTDQPLARLRGKVHQVPGTDIPVVVTYHPAYLLKQLNSKSKAWEDLKLARSVF